MLLFMVMVGSVGAEHVLVVRIAHAWRLGITAVGLLPRLYLGGGQSGTSTVCTLQSVTSYCLKIHFGVGVIDSS